MSPSVDVVVPTVGRPTLALLLAALDGPPSRLPAHVVVVDDRRRPRGPLPFGAVSPELRERIDVCASGGRGPAAARNRGWRASRAEWIAFLDDDVVPCRGWLAELGGDLAGLPTDVAGSQGRIRVPLPDDREPTDRERGVLGLETARWASADIAYRTDVLRRLGGFDERFRRAYREDADLGLRVRGAGLRIARGRRTVVHPPWPAGFWASVRAQAGNADDALMRALHGHGWRRAASAPAGRLRRHVAITAAGLGALAAGVAGAPIAAAVAGAGWLAGTAELAWARIAPGPRTPAEVVTMLATSVAIPPAAVWHRVRGELRAPWVARRALVPARTVEIDAVLFDRDGTLVHDLPANRDPAAVRPLAGAREAVQRLRAAGMRVAVVTNQAAIGEGLVRPEELRAVNERIDRLLGPFDAWLVCPHPASAACACRKPAPGLVRTALRALGVPPERCALVGDTGADVDAARAAGVRPILVPNAVTRREEIVAAPEVARDLVEAADRLLGAHA